MKKQLIILSLLCFIISGCASVKSAQKGGLTVTRVTDKIIKGQTIQEDVLEAFGEPITAKINRNGNAIWTYEIASSARTLTLMIEFDGNDIVKGYSYRTSAFE